VQTDGVAKHTQNAKYRENKKTAIANFKEFLLHVDPESRTVLELALHGHKADDLGDCILYFLASHPLRIDTELR
jgi:hypothetical protein